MIPQQINPGTSPSLPSPFRFELIHQSKRSRARVGKLHTPHGIIDTPNFVAVGTNATLKAIDSYVLEALEVQLLFCNTYHLVIQPGLEVIAQAGGLHRFMQRNAPIITDSGGFQVFSLAYGTVHEELKSKGCKKQQGSVIKISEEGVLFRSYRDGERILLTPEKSIQAQKILGADIIIPFDELPPYHIGSKALQKSVERTHRWEQRSLEEHLKNPQQQALYSVIHGGIDMELRAHSTRFLSNLPFNGHAIGGSLGKNRTEMVHMLRQLMPLLPPELPVHLLGIGDIASLQETIGLGIDTFDSSYPTRAARHGMLLHPQGNLHIEQNKYKMDFTAIDAQCDCLTCTRYTRAYVHHLFKAHELSAYSLASIHNVRFMVRLMRQYREAILRGEF